MIGVIVAGVLLEMILMVMETLIFWLQLKFKVVMKAIFI